MPEQEILVGSFKPFTEPWSVQLNRVGGSRQVNVPGVVIGRAAARREAALLMDGKKVAAAGLQKDPQNSEMPEAERPDSYLFAMALSLLGRVAECGMA